MQGMSNAKQCYQRIHRTLKEQAGGEVKGNGARRLIVFAMMIVGLIRAGHASLGKMSDKSPKYGTSQGQSRIQRYTRWIKQKANEAETLYFPYIKYILAGLSKFELVFSIDASAVGKHCAVLMISVIYKQRALPVLWLVRKGNKGVFSEADHVKLLGELQSLLNELASSLENPLAASLVGDGEFDGVKVQAYCHEQDWSYVFRASQNANCYALDDQKAFKPRDLAQQGHCISIPDIAYTDARYAHVHLLVTWHEDYQEPLYLVSNLELAEQACLLYQQRSLIETFFSDQKTRGFHIHKSRLKDPKRISRLLLVACFAYLWIVYLGSLAKQNNLQHYFRRKDRSVLSLFQLGFCYLDYLLERDLPLPMGFFLPLDFWDESVWF